MQDVAGDFGTTGEDREKVPSMGSNPSRNRDHRGRFVSPSTTTVSESDVLAAVWAGGDLVTPSAIANALDTAPETVRSHLRSLQETSALERAGDGSGTVWRLPDRDE